MKSEDLTCQNEIQNNMDTINNAKIEVNIDNSNLAEIKKTSRRNKKYVIKNIFSDYEGLDFRSAWGRLSRD